jgi:S-adenosylmethionine:tRNA ribosyltransferase-isomerase
MTGADRGRYQTVYAQKPGSVAAPTAGLHFTPELLQHLRSAGIAYTTVTLHVGIGTFRPIQAERLEDHRMHSEYGEISDSSARRIQATRSEGGRIIAVGTTSVRLLESAVAAEPMDARGRPMSFHVWRGETDLFIRPGFSFHVVDGMLTNFHLPKSSLLVMVCALAGRKFVLRAYQEAIRESYRFYSYGDCMLIL